MNNETKKSITGDITPLPWRLADDLVTGLSIPAQVSVFTPIAETYTNPIRRNNAAYIVKACNLFPELIDVLKEVVEMGKQINEKDTRETILTEIGWWVKKAEELINKAK